MYNLVVNFWKLIIKSWMLWIEFNTMSLYSSIIFTNINFEPDDYIPQENMHFFVSGIYNKPHYIFKSK